MRILVLTSLYPPHAYGGYERCCKDVVDRFVDRGHDVLVLTSDDRVPATSTEPEVPGVERTLPMAWGLRRPPAPWRRPALRRRAQRALAASIARQRPEVVSVWNMAGLPSPLLRAIPDIGQVWIFADAWPERALLGDPWLAPAAHHPGVARFAGWPTMLPDLGQRGTLCFCSADLRDRIAASTGWSLDRATVTPLGVDRRDFPAVGSPTGEKWSWRLLFVGRLDPGKGIDTLIRSLLRLPSAVRLTVVAPPEPTHLERVRALIAGHELGDRVELTSMPRDRLAAVYRDADACVFPSEWDEPFGIVPLEAMACGTPVVATGVGGSGEYLRSDENCVLFTPGDDASLASTLTALAGDRALRNRVVAGGTRTAGRLTVDRLADQLEGLHREAIRR